MGKDPLGAKKYSTRDALQDMGALRLGVNDPSIRKLDLDDIVSELWAAVIEIQAFIQQLPDLLRGDYVKKESRARLEKEAQDPYPGYLTPFQAGLLTKWAKGSAPKAELSPPDTPSEPPSPFQKELLKRWGMK